MGAPLDHVLRAHTGACSRPQPAMAGQ
jgi:hypothetical protein